MELNNIKKTIEALTDKANTCTAPNDALMFTQAALNLAHTEATLSAAAADTDEEQIDMPIIEEINRVLADSMRTGDQVSSIYLGRVQMGRLMKWVEDNCYIVNAETENRKGKSRPEVNGIPVYEVKDEDHCAVA